MSRASLTIGYPVYVCMRPNVSPVFLTRASSSSASATLSVIGFSHITLNPASRHALAMGKCVWFGVQIATKSMRSSFDSANSPAIMSR